MREKLAKNLQRCCLEPSDAAASTRLTTIESVLLRVNKKLTYAVSSFDKGSHHVRKTVKKVDNVRFGRPPPLNG